MAQAPATPKVKRTLLRAAASISPDLALRLSPAPSERAALAARHRPPGPDSADDDTRPKEVVFLIPLVGRHHVSDWDAVSGRLARTLASFGRQTSPRWRAVICGQDTPTDLPTDPRFRFLRFTEEVAGNDKWRKLAGLADALKDVGVHHGYAMPFDADDLLAPWVVEQMLNRNARGGYLVTHGLIRDVGAAIWAQSQPQSLRSPRQKAFWKLCGSCAAFAFNTRSGDDDAALIGAITQHEHRMFPYLARLAGRPLTPIEGNAAAYLLNHGENFGVRRGRVSFKTRFAARFRISDPALLATAEGDFPLA